MGGTGSVARNQAETKPSGSAAKYEDKSADSAPASKQVESKGVDKVAKVEDSQTATSDIAEPKILSGKSPVEPEVEKESDTNNQQRNNDLEPVGEITEGLIRAEGRDTFPDPSQPLIRQDNSASQIALFTVGDFVKVRNEDGSYSEGMLLEVVDEEKVVVDFGTDGVVKQVRADDCELIVQSDIIEIGDQVQVQPVGSAMFFVGRVQQVNADGTYDVVMEGDDPDDMEKSVPESNIRKLMSRRAIVVARWKRAALVVSSINNFQSFALDPNLFSGSLRGNPESVTSGKDRRDSGGGSSVT